MEQFFGDLLVLGGINAIMVAGLNLQYGFTGMLNFAFYMYVALGAYVAGVTTMGPSRIPGVTYILHWTLPWYVGLLLAGLAAVVMGGVIFSFTVRRLRSDYLGIVTVSVAYIFWNFANNDVSLFDGAQGI
jgi:branched-chain amino acid transport system permease protein